MNITSSVDVSSFNFALSSFNAFDWDLVRLDFFILKLFGKT